jgi:hypothetical protein
MGIVASATRGQGGRQQNPEDSSHAPLRRTLDLFFHHSLSATLDFCSAADVLISRLTLCVLGDTQAPIFLRLTCLFREVSGVQQSRPQVLTLTAKSPPPSAEALVKAPTRMRHTVSLAESESLANR